MTLDVLLFGPHADAAKQSSIRVTLPADCTPTADSVLARLAEQHPGLRGLLGSAVLAVNCSHVPGDTPVGESDELAVIGMVSGG